MSIRTLTERLHQEAAEARRRQGYATTRGVGETPDDIQPAVGSSTGSIFVSNRSPKAGGSAADSQPAIPARPVPSPSVRRARTRPRDLAEQWGVPGGIAARFALVPGKRPVDETIGSVDPLVAQEQPEAVPASADRQPKPREEVVQTEQAPEPAVDSAQEQASPITIELKSH